MGHGVTDFYTNGSYRKNNPTWGSEDANWKAATVFKSFRCLNDIKIASIIDIGCGTGAVLQELSRLIKLDGGPTVDIPDLVGFDIAPDLEEFWSGVPNVRFITKPLSSINGPFDVALVLDVVEHVENPHQFLQEVADKARYVVIHFPLDLSVVSLLAGAPLRQRKAVGHIHYYYRDLAEALVNECQLDIVASDFTSAYLRPASTFKGRVAALTRRALSSLSPCTSARLLGGDTLLIVAKSRQYSNC